MTNIERYLRGVLPYDELTDAERCAICAAKEGRFVRRGRNLIKGATYEQLHETTGGNECWLNCTYYLYDGTAALRLVERFRLMIQPAGPEWACYPINAFAYPSGDTGYGSTPATAIGACVCEIAKAEWPYKEGK